MKLFLFNNDEKLIGTVSPLEGIQNEEINKIQTIECTVVYSELIEKASYIGHKDYSDNRIFHLYKIDHVTKTSTTAVKIVGVHTFFDDMESDGYVKDFRPTNRELVGVLTTILDGSRWQLGTVNIQRRYTGNFYYVTRKEALSKLIEATQIEIKPRLEFSRGKITGRYLDVFTRLGGRNGKVFVHGRDLLTVSEKKSQGAIYTAVVGRGKGEETDTGGYGRRITFKDVEWRKSSGNPVDKPVGQEYVEIPAMTKLYGFEKGTKPRIKIVEFQDEEDKEKLLRLSYEWLEKNSRMQVEYSAKVLNVGNLELGDTVGIFNPKLGIKYETRVFKVKRNLVDNKLTEFGIGDKVTTSPFSRTIELAKEMKNFQDDTVYWLDKIRERLSDKLINEDGYNYDLKADNEYKVPAGYYSFDKPIDQNPTKVVYMGAGKIAIANSKKPTGEWNWKTFLDGRGATLDLINTGVLRAGRIQSADGRSYWDLDTGEFHMEQSAINEAVKTVINGKVQEIVGEVKKNLPTKEELKGKSSYLHTKYSDNANGTPMSDNSTLKYIGIYTGDKQQAPTNASEYSWTKIRGEDGARGRDGNNGRDGVDGKSINENLLPNSNFNQGFAKWEDKLTNSGLNHSFDHANFHFGRGLHIYGTANADYKGLSSVPFNLIAKQGDKLTLSMDLGKDALTQNAPLRLALHYMDDRDAIVSQQWQTIDLATQNFEVKKYKRISMVFTVQNEIRKCRVMIYATVRQLINFYIDNIKLERGEVATEWSPAYEDLRGRDGVSNYIHRKYSDYSNGANMSDNSNLKYIGIYTGTSPTPPTTASSYLWSKIKGEDGANGTPGVKGADGRTPYFHTAYANSPTGDRDFSTTNSNDKLYIGTYSDFEVADSTDYRRYKWVKIKGENGRDGVSSYIYRKYSDNANGSPMSDNSNLKYIGIYTGTSATAPTTPSAYTWSKIKGEDGVQGVPGARGSDGRTSYLHTAYSNSATGDRDFSTTNSINKEYIGTYSDFEINDSNDYRRYKWVKIKGENGRDGNNGRDGRNGDSYARNYLSGTAEEKILTAVNDNFTTQEAFKLVDDKNFRDLGFVVGDKVTFVADYEILPNGTNKKISKLNFEWYDSNRYRYWMTQEINPTKGTFTRTVTANNDLLDSKRAFLRTDNVNAKVKITNARVIKGDTVQPWSIAQEDLQGHTLTANVRFEGTYINNVTNNLQVFLDVYYDGRKVPSGFNAQVKYKGGNRSDWSNFWNANVDSTGRITNIDWGNREQNGEPLDVIVLVTYKDKDAIASARTDNTPNIGELKETIQRYKKFESTLSEFRSEIGYVKETTQILGDTVPDLSKDKRTTTGNDVYFYPSVPLKANTPYTIVANISGLTAKQEAGIYNASGNNKKYILNGTNFWVVQFPSQQDRVNFYPLGTKTTISNVRIYEGDFTEALQGNLYVTYTINPKDNKMILISLNKRVEGSDLVFYFDVDGDVNNKSFRYSNAFSNFSPETDVEFSLKNKDNVVSVGSFGNSGIALLFSYANPTIKNVRVYEVNYAFRKLTKTQTQNIGTVFKQSAEDIIIAWNNYNKYFSFNNETLDILEKDSYQNKYKKISLTSEGLKIYNNNTLIGTIGTFTHLGQSFRQNTFDIVLTDDTKAFGVYTWQDFSAFGSRTTGYAPLFEIKKDEGGTYRSYFHQPLQVRTAYIDRLSVAETGTSYVGGVTKTINVGGRYLKFVQGILVSG